jgi:hypothetical protein
MTKKYPFVVLLFLKLVLPFILTQLLVKQYQVFTFSLMSEVEQLKDQLFVFGGNKRGQLLIFIQEKLKQLVLMV